jgi:hypothetical protein
MKPDTHEQAVKLVPAVAGIGVTLADISTIITILAGICTILYILVQMAFLIRKWWLLETKGHIPKWEDPSKQ